MCKEETLYFAIHETYFILEILIDILIFLIARSFLPQWTFTLTIAVKCYKTHRAVIYRSYVRYLYLCVSPSD